MPKMKMPKMKLDFSRIKGFLLAKGERVALAVCGGIALLLLVFTFMGAMGAAKPKDSNDSYEEAFKKQTSVLKDKIDRAGLPTTSTDDEGTPPPPPTTAPFTWFPAKPLPQNPFFTLGDQVDTKRRQPQILLAHPERVAAQIVQGGYFQYEFDPKTRKVKVFKGMAGGPGMPGPGIPGPGMPGPKMPGPGMPPAGGPGMAGGAEPPAVKKFVPVRMVVMSTVFNMKAQMEAFRSALRHPSLDDLVAAGDIPRATGLIVYRAEMPAEGWAKARWVPVYDVNTKTGDTKIDAKQFPNTYQMFHLGIFDTAEPHIYGPHAVGGTMTWLPKLGNAEIPAVKLDGITVDEAARNAFQVAGGPDGGPMGGGGVPPMAGGGRPGLPGGMPGPKKGPDGGDPMAGGEWEMVDVDKFPAQKERLLGTLKPFFTRDELLGAAAAGPDGKPPVGPPGFPPGMPPPGMPPMGKGPMPGPGGDWFGKEGLAGTLPPDEVMVRFVDADVVPGKTYRYAVKVRFANPNFDRSEKEVAFLELTKDRELTSKVPWQSPEDVSIPSEFHYYVVDESPKSKLVGGSDVGGVSPDQLTIQIHSWIQNAFPAGSAIPIGDWAIAERLLIRRGEYIGRQSVRVEVPTWEPMQNAFRVLTIAEAAKKGAPKGDTTGIVLDFSGDFSIRPTEPLKHALVDFEGGRKTAKGDSPAAYALILTPDGKLTVRDSQADSTSTIRADRISATRKRIDDAKATPAPAGGGGGGLPGAGM